MPLPYPSDGSRRAGRPALQAAAATSPFDQRWPAWPGPGAAHEDMVRGALVIVVPIAAVAAAALYLLLVG